MNENPLEPNEAIRLLYSALAQPSVAIVPKYVAQDLANLRRAHSDDVAFSNAVRAVAKEILAALRNPAKYGVDTEFALVGWRRCRFASIKGGAPHLRLVFRKRNSGGIEILAFGDRAFPDSVYLTATQRV